MDAAALGNTPVSEQNPAGEDVRYDPEFELVQAEIDKLSSPTASGQVDWALIEEKCAFILQNKSKDLTIASYYAAAAAKNRQIDGLDDGATVLKEMVVAFWDTLFPKKKRMRGRAAAITWWLERTEALFQNVEVAPLAVAQVAHITGNLKDLDAFLGENMPDAPLLRPLQRVVESFPIKQEAPPPEEKPMETAAPSAAEGTPPKVAAPAAPKPAAPAPAAASGGGDDMSGAIADAKEARRAADAAFQRLRQTCLFLLNDDLKNPLAYRYRRLAAWAAASAVPPNGDGDTQIPPPAPQVVESLVSLREEGKLEALVQNCEQKLSQFIFWFDINRMVAEALLDLGDGHQKAMAAVCEETAYLLQRLPGIEALRFSDGTPFADAATLAWLKSIRFGGTSSQEGAGTKPQPAGSGEMGGVVQKARALARKKKLVEAIAMLQVPMQLSLAESEKLRWRLAIAGLLLEVKKPQAALAHLEQILADIDRFELEQWEPALAVEGLTAGWQGFHAQPGGDYKERAELLLQRIARIDPSAALQLSK